MVFDSDRNSWYTCFTKYEQEVAGGKIKRRSSMNEETTKLVLANLELINQKLVTLNEDVSELKSDVRGLKSDVSELKSDVSELKSDVSELKSDVSDLKNRMDLVEGEQRNLRFILENVTNKKIDVIGDGHVDLVRRLDEARELQRDKERMELEILNLSLDMSAVKRRIGLA